MVCVLTRLTTEHDWQIVLLAGAVCFLTSLAAINLLRRAGQQSGRLRAIWTATAGIAAGCGIWATHFIAVLAYDPGLALTFQLGRTVLSLVVALATTSAGIAVAVGATTLRWRAPLGGAIVGAGIGAMHVLGIWAIDMPASLSWRMDLVAASILLSIGLGALALGLAAWRTDAWSLAGAAVLLTLAILSHHFTAMGALRVVPEAALAASPLSISPLSLAIAVAGVAVAVLGVSLVAALADRWVEARRDRFDQAERQLVAETNSQLRENHLRLDTALNNMSQGLCMFDDEARLVICNGRYLRMYDLPAEVGRPGTPLREMLSQRARANSFTGNIDEYIATLQASIRSGKTTSIRRELTDGRAIVVVNHPMRGGGWVATHEDVTEQRRAEERISYLAHHDTLTGLANRAAFANRMMAIIERAQAAKQSFAVLSIDIDRLKEVNDVFGHAAGDGLLREAARRLRQAAAGAFVARLGGDEFTLVIDGGAQPAAASNAANRLLAAFREDIEIEGRKLRTGISIGIAVYPGDGEDTATLLSNADAALYRAKADGRGTARFFEADMDMQLRERRALQQDLRGAIESNQLAIHYQPQAGIDGAVSGFEALVRWRHPKLGLVSPAQFIPLAEEDGLIIPIGEWILREACREAASWPRPLSVAVNLSPIQFRRGDLPALVHSVLMETGLAPQRLELEITEGVLIGDFSRAVSVLRRLKLLGVRIAMDDFGTGYSSLSYLQSFPFDKIKIDRSFISNVERSQQSSAIVRAVIGLAQAINVPVLAEGVETEEQLRFLSAAACDEMQGYLIGRPAPIDDYAELTGQRAERAARRAAG